MKKFDEIFTFSTGKNIKQNEASSEFETPCVRYGELYHMYDEVISKIINRTNLDKSELLFSQGNEILLPSAGEDPMDIGSASALTIENVAIGRTINILKPLKANIYSQIFVAYYINHKLKKNISKLAKGVSISNVYNSDLKTLKINLPSLSEQHKIATLFTAIDTKIDQLIKKQTLLKQYKKGVMQKLISQELRFNADDGSGFFAWEEKTLGDVCTIKKGTQLNRDDLDDSGKYAVINGGITPSGYNDEWNIEANTITISEGGNSCGFVNFMKEKFWAGGHCYTLGNVKNSVSNDFLYQYLKALQIQLMRLRVGSGLPNIQKGDITKFKITIPSSIEEQTEIANFFTAIDTKINLVNKQLNATKQFKKALLQQMFV